MCVVFYKLQNLENNTDTLAVCYIKVCMLTADK